jgi:hypothetical protein
LASPLHGGSPQSVNAADRRNRRSVRSRPGALLTLFILGSCEGGIGGMRRAPSQRDQCSASRDRPAPCYMSACGEPPHARASSHYSSEAPRREGISNGNFFGASHAPNVMSCIVNIGPGTGDVATEPVAMQTIVPLDRTMQLPLNLAGGLRSTFAEGASSPLPERLAALVRRLNAERTASSREGLNDGASTRKSSPVHRRGRC